jgi:hypothetical protein
MSQPRSTRPCGLYRTTEELATENQTVPAGVLVHFHNHAGDTPPFIALPAKNTHNRWAFHHGGIPVTDAAYIDSLEPRLSEGFYRLREHFHPDEGHIVPANALVQLGYNRAADPIIFHPRASKSDNALVFPEKGTKIPPPVYELLERLDTGGPRKPTALH